MIRLLLAIVLVSAFLPRVALGISCDADVAGEPQLHNVEATPFRFQFDSGATWELCWHVDPAAGLVLSRVYYAAPTEALRQIFDAVSIGQILFKYDEDEIETPLLSEYGLGGSHGIDDNNHRCTEGELLSAIDGSQICSRARYRDPLSKVRRSESKPRHEVTLDRWSRIGTHEYQQLWRLSEDGEIKPSVLFSGTVNRFTNDPDYGVRLGDVEQYASSATLLVNWRLDFNINGTPANDRVDELQFSPAEKNATENAGFARDISVEAIENESMRVTNREHFRGWRISDADQSSVDSSGVSGDTGSRIGYYLDPQGAGHRVVSQTHLWSEFDFFVTRRKACEQLSSDNTARHQGCAEGLDAFVDGESLSSADTVVWYSVSRHFSPRLEDYPAITATEISFTLAPFDWSAQSMFSVDPAVVDSRPEAVDE